MNRREFIKLACAAGLLPFAHCMMRTVSAENQGSYEGPLLLFVQAYGGWDPLQFCDPKPDLNRGFAADEIEAAGGLRFAPVHWADGDITYDYARDLLGEFHRRMVVVQGINMQTNVHHVGAVNAFQGNFATGFPTLSAALSAAIAPSLLMSYLVSSEYWSTGGLLPYTPMSQADGIRDIALPNQTLNLGNGISPHVMPPEVLKIIDVERSSRIQERLAEEFLMPRERYKLLELVDALEGSEALSQLANNLPPDDFQLIDERGIANDLVKKSDMVLHAMASRLTAAADLQVSNGYFDSHANHSQQQGYWLANLVYGLRFLWRRAEEIDARTGSNITDRLTVVIHSEFGRTPHFNADGGTDHWPTTSAIIMRKDFETTGIGSRTVGYSTNDGRYQPGRINPVTLEPDESGGIELTSAHLHKALREYLGIADSPVLARFGFPGVESVNMFTPGLATPQT